MTAQTDQLAKALILIGGAVTTAVSTTILSVIEHVPNLLERFGVSIVVAGACAYGMVFLFKWLMKSQADRITDRDSIIAELITELKSARDQRTQSIAALGQLKDAVEDQTETTNTKLNDLLIAIKAKTQ
jgi:hypothetical protein